MHPQPCGEHAGAYGDGDPAASAADRSPPLRLSIARLTGAADAAQPDPGGPPGPLTGPATLLAQVDYGAAHCRPVSDPRRLGVGLTPLAPPLRELWHSPPPVVTGWAQGIGFAQGPEVLFAHLLLDDTGDADLAQLTLTAYTRLLAFTLARGFPHPLRMWNFLSRIHARDGGLERYQAFCVGRERAFALTGLAPARFPAATAVGTDAPGLLVYLLAGRAPGVAVENPRQVSAYRYPPRYGPRPPSFARALRPPWPNSSPFFISGTASVVGHRSLHPGALGPQLHETLANLDALLAAAAAARPAFLKVFLRDPRHLAQTRAGLRDWAGPGTPVLYLQAEVCRAELQIEIEGVCGPAPEASE